MKILLVNANTTQAITDRIAAEARAAASPGTEIVAVTGDVGAKVIGTRTENAIGAQMMIALMARHHHGCDAAVNGVSFDTGLGATRELLPIPVVGMTEAALLTACMLGGQFGFLAPGRRGAAVYRELIAAHGLAGRMAALRVLDASPAAYLDPSGIEADILAAVEALIADGAESVIVSGAAFAGFARRLQPRANVPLIDGIACGVLQAELLARLKLPKPTAGSHAAVPARELSGVDPAIGRLFGEKS